MTSDLELQAAIDEATTNAADERRQLPSNLAELQAAIKRSRAAIVRSKKILERTAPGARQRRFVSQWW